MGRPSGVLWRRCGRIVLPGESGLPVLARFLIEKRTAFFVPSPFSLSFFLKRALGRKRLPFARSLVPGAALGPRRTRALAARRPLIAAERGPALSFPCVTPWLGWPCAAGKRAAIAAGAFVKIAGRPTGAKMLLRRKGRALERRLAKTPPARRKIRAFVTPPAFIAAVTLRIARGAAIAAAWSAAVLRARGFFLAPGVARRGAKSTRGRGRPLMPATRVIRRGAARRLGRAGQPRRTSTVRRTLIAPRPRLFSPCGMRSPEPWPRPALAMVFSHKVATWLRPMQWY